MASSKRKCGVHCRHSTRLTRILSLGPPHTIVSQKYLRVPRSSVALDGLSVPAKAAQPPPERNYRLVPVAPPEPKSLAKTSGVIHRFRASLHRGRWPTVVNRLCEGLLELHVLRLGLTQNRNIGVSVFPQIEKILVGSASLGFGLVRCLIPKRSRFQNPGAADI